MEGGATSGSRVARKSYWCGHCNKFVSKTVYYQHKGKYYSPDTCTWSHGDEETHQESEDFKLSDDEGKQLQNQP